MKPKNPSIIDSKKIYGMLKTAEIYTHVSKRYVEGKKNPLGDISEGST
jgi:hypothetical protein